MPATRPRTRSKDDLLRWLRQLSRTGHELTPDRFPTCLACAKTFVDLDEALNTQCAPLTELPWRR